MLFCLLLAMLFCLLLAMLFCLLLAMLFCLLLAMLLLHGFLGPFPGCFKDHHSNFHHWLQHEIFVVHGSSQLLTWCTAYSWFYNSWHTVTALGIDSIQLTSNLDPLSKHPRLDASIAVTPLLIKCTSLAHLFNNSDNNSNSCKIELSSSSWRFLALSKLSTFLTFLHSCPAPALTQTHKLKRSHAVCLAAASGLGLAVDLRILGPFLSAPL